MLASILAPVTGMAESALIEYSEPLQEFELEKSTYGEAARFNAFGKRFDVSLAPNQNILSLAVRERLAEGISVYRGSVDGMANSWVRLVVADGMPRGLLWDGAEMYAIEPIADGGGAAHMFRLSDMQIPQGTMTCAHADAPTSASELLTAVSKEIGPSVVAAAGANSSLDLAVIADFEFASAKGGDTQTALVTRINNVDGIFSEQLGVQINLARTDIFASPNDPFTDESDGGRLLDELAEYRSANANQRANGLTHLFTGRDLDGSTVGVAFTGALCRNAAGAGLTQGTHSDNLDSLIAAHEIGHNFGAPHDGTSGSACEGTSQDFLMAPRLNGSDTFSSCSIQQMQDDVSRASCITALPTLDVEVVASQPGDVLLGDSETVSFVVNNVGTDDATGVDFNVSIPLNVTLDSISSSAGSCSSGGGSASCSFGSLSAGASATVNLAVTSSITGNGDFAATVTTADDDNSGNDSATITLNVTPAVDVLVRTTPISVTINQGGTVQVTVENDSPIAATAVEVTIVPGTGIRLDSASWSAGTCSLAGGNATCDAASLAVRSSSTISVQLTGLAEGGQSYNVTVAADETDRSTGNNSAQGQVTVSEPAQDNGGGAFGVLELLALLMLMLARVRAPVGRPH
ncbi:MAG: M12 family metallo-peptidase [Woeseiaceae bacterium]|nr:M12 family metallo-peptidase [Woeseiaceae bacterium]